MNVTLRFWCRTFKYLLAKHHQLYRWRQAQRTFTVGVFTERPVTALGACFYGRSFKLVSRCALELALCFVGGIGHFARCRFHGESFLRVQRKWAASHSFSMMKQRLLVYRKYYQWQRFNIRLSNTEHNNSIVFNNCALFDGGLGLLRAGVEERNREKT